MVEEKETTTIRLKLETKNSLDKIGQKNDSYDDIVIKLLKEHGDIE